METLLSILIGFMIIGALYALHARDLLSALIAQGTVGYGLVICFLHLRAPDLAIVQIVVETITLVIMVAVVLNSTRKEIRESWNRWKIANTVFAFLIVLFLIFVFTGMISSLQPFGEHSLRMAEFYTYHGAEKTGSANLVTGVLWDFRAYDTLGEAIILFTAAIGVITILRSKSKKTLTS
ncbi:MAG: hydrogen gas-evolving membrane-bound hydrogenase subunit E [Bacteroidales bacterium]